MSCGLTEPDIGKPPGVREKLRHLVGCKPGARFIAYEFQRLGDMFVVQRKQPRRSPAHNPDRTA